MIILSFSSKKPALARSKVIEFHDDKEKWGPLGSLEKKISCIGAAFFSGQRKIVTKIDTEGNFPYKSLRKEWISREQRWAIKVRAE